MRLCINTCTGVNICINASLNSCITVILYNIYRRFDRPRGEKQSRAMRLSKYLDWKISIERSRSEYLDRKISIARARSQELDRKISIARFRSQDLDRKILIARSWSQDLDQRISIEICQSKYLEIEISRDWNISRSKYIEIEISRHQNFSRSKHLENETSRDWSVSRSKLPVVCPRYFSKAMSHFGCCAPLLVLPENRSNGVCLTITRYVRISTSIHVIIPWAGFALDMAGVSSGGDGGAIYTEKGSKTAFTRKSTMLRNLAGRSGGAVYNAGMMRFGTSADFHGNRASVRLSVSLGDRSSIPTTVHDLIDLYDLYDLAHAAGWEPYNLHDLGRASWVGSVQSRSCTSHSCRLRSRWSRSCVILLDCTINDEYSSERSLRLTYFEVHPTFGCNLLDLSAG